MNDIGRRSGPVWIEYTGCCALSQLRVQVQSEYDLNRVLELHQQDVLEGSKLGGQGGAPTLFCIVTPDEHWLSVWLFNDGWTKVGELERRVGYPPGQLEMWVKEFSKKAAQQAA